jgi:hypothetical protein
LYARQGDPTGGLDQLPDRDRQLLDEDVLVSGFLEPEPESDFEEDDEAPSEFELLLLESDEDDEEDSDLLELSLASFISRERLRVP